MVSFLSWYSLSIFGAAGGEFVECDLHGLIDGDFFGVRVLSPFDFDLAILEASGTDDDS